MKTSPVLTQEQKKTYVKSGVIAMCAGIGALHGVDRFLRKEEGSVEVRRILSPLDNMFFDFISKSKLGKDLTTFMRSSNLKDAEHKVIGNYRFNPTLMFKGAIFGAALYIIPKLIIKLVDKAKYNLDK